MGLLESLRTCLYIDANYDAALEVINEAAIANWENPEHLPLLQSLELRCLAAEIFDYAGKYRHAADVIGQSGDQALDYLSSAPNLAQEENRLFYRQQVWTAIHLGYVQYRDGDFEKANVTFAICEKAVAVLISLGYPCSGTMARLKYSQGLIHRERFEYASAKQCFTLCVKYSSAYLDGVLSAGSSQSVVAEFQIAKALALGLAWVHCAEGNLHLAIPLLLAAKTTLARNRHAELIHAYVDVIYCSVIRLGSNDPQILNEAIKTLERSYAIFRRRHHESYGYRAAQELALAYMQQCRTVRDRERTKDSQEKARSYVAQLSFDPRMRTQAIRYLLESRIERDSNNPHRAKDYAQQALEVAQRAGIYGKAITVDAFLALGEADLQLGDPEKALGHFLEAFQLGFKNPAIAGRTLLFMAMAHAKAGRVRETLESWSQWQAIRPQIESAAVLDLEIRAEKELEPIARDFVLRLSDKDLNKDTIFDVKDFLMRWAKSKSETNKQAATLLGITTQTLYNWEKQCFKQKNKKASSKLSSS